MSYPRYSKTSNVSKHRLQTKIELNLEIKKSKPFIRVFSIFAGVTVANAESLISLFAQAEKTMQGNFGIQYLE